MSVLLICCLEVFGNELVGSIKNDCSLDSFKKIYFSKNFSKLDKEKAMRNSGLYTRLDIMEFLRSQGVDVNSCGPISGMPAIYYLAINDFYSAQEACNKFPELNLSAFNDANKNMFENMIIEITKQAMENNNKRDSALLFKMVDEEKKSNSYKPLTPSRFVILLGNKTEEYGSVYIPQIIKLI